MTGEFDIDNIDGPGLMQRFRSEFPALEIGWYPQLIQWSQDRTQTMVYAEIVDDINQLYVRLGEDLPDGQTEEEFAGVILAKTLHKFFLDYDRGIRGPIPETYGRPRPPKQ